MYISSRLCQLNSHFPLQTVDDVYARDNVTHLLLFLSVFTHTSLLNSKLHGQLRIRLTVGKTPRPGGRF